MLLTVESGKHSDPLGALGLGLISSFLEVLDNTSDSPTARVLIKDVAAGIVAFQPMSLYELFQKVGKGYFTATKLSPSDHGLGPPFIHVYLELIKVLAGHMGEGRGGGPRQRTRRI